MAQPNPPQSGATQKPGQEPVSSPLSFKIGGADFTPGGWADITGFSAAAISEAEPALPSDLFRSTTSFRKRL